MLSRSNERAYGYGSSPRLSERSSIYLRRAESLAAGKHSFHTGEGGSGDPELRHTGNLFVLLQNEAGHARFEVRDSSIAEIVNSMGSMNDHRVVATATATATTPVSFAGDFVTAQVTLGILSFLLLWKWGKSKSPVLARWHNDGYSTLDLGYSFFYSGNGANRVSWFWRRSSRGIMTEIALWILGILSFRLLWKGGK
jgi:hypothetical protein